MEIQKNLNMEQFQVIIFNLFSSITWKTLISGGLEPVLRYAEKLRIELYYIQCPMNKKM